MDERPAPEDFYKGLELYWRGCYWYSHEHWEQVWLQEQEPIRSFMKALIQIDAALIHSERREWRGVSNLLGRVAGYLESCPPQIWGIDIADLQRQVAHYRTEVDLLLRGDKEQFVWQCKPRIRPSGIAAPHDEALRRCAEDGPNRKSKR